LSIPGRARERLTDDFVCPPLEVESIWLNPARRAWLMADPRRYRRRAVWGHAAWSRSVWVRSASRRYALPPEPRPRFRIRVLAFVAAAAIAFLFLAALAIFAWR
jgi:hypothetical protein